MESSFILTPYFLDEPKGGMRPLAESSWQVNEPPLPAGERQERMAALYRPLRDYVAAAASQGRRPVSIAGDCCTTLGVLAGLQKAELHPTLIWFDAHGDFNTWETTPSGFLGGMPLAMMVGRGEQTMVEGVGLRPLAEELVILTDGRDLDPGERLAVEASAVAHLPEVTTLVGAVPEGPLWVHFDVDVLDPEALPAVNYPAPGGPSVATLLGVFQHLAQTGQVAALSVSAWDPELDQDGASLKTVMALVKALVA